MFYDNQLAGWKVCAIGSVLLVVMAAVIYCRRAKLDFGFLLLAACLAIAIVSSITRNSVTAIDPVLAGPRYFFFPYIFLSWLVIQIAYIGGALSRALVVIVMALSVQQAYIYGQRTHDTINWKTEIHACTVWKTYQLPVHYDGARERAWQVNLTGQDCTNVISRSVF